MTQSVLEAIRLGDWEFDPGALEPSLYPSTNFIPGSDDKLGVLAERVQQGLPLWHPHDRQDYSELENV